MKRTDSPICRVAHSNAFHNYPTFGRKAVLRQDDNLGAEADTRNPGVKQVICACASFVKYALNTNRLRGYWVYYNAPLCTFRMHNKQRSWIHVMWEDSGWYFVLWVMYAVIHRHSTAGVTQPLTLR